MKSRRELLEKLKSHYQEEDPRLTDERVLKSVGRILESPFEVKVENDQIIGDIPSSDRFNRVKIYFHRKLENVRLAQEDRTLPGSPEKSWDKLYITGIDEVESHLNHLEAQIMKEEIEEDFRSRTDEDIEQVTEFEQEWSDGATGFEDFVGAQAFTDATTHVIETASNTFHVYHQGQHAYSVADPTEKFFEDLEDESLLGEEEFNEDPSVYLSEEPL